MKFRLTSPRIKKSENDVERACLDLLRWHGLHPERLHVGLFHPYQKFNQVVQMGERGLPDYVIPAFYMEVKKPGGHLSEDQLIKISELDQLWYLKTVVPHSVEELKEFLNQNPNLLTRKTK